MADARSVQAREAHHLAGLAERQADQYREQRDRLIVLLRNEDPQRWTYSALAKAIGCSPELVAAVLKGRTRRQRRDEQAQSR